MFSISSFLPKKSHSGDLDGYVKVSSMIEEGSVLDRRKYINKRRLLVDRRTILGGFFSGVEKRILEQRRVSFTRRESNQEENEIIETVEGLSLNENNLALLIKEQVAVIKKIGELSLSAKNLEFGETKEQIQQVSRVIRFQVKKEQHYLHLHLARGVNDFNDEAGASLSDIHSENYNTSDRVLQLLEKHQITDLSTSSVGFFLLDMNIVLEELKGCLEKKQSYLYPKYL